MKTVRNHGLMCRVAVLTVVLLLTLGMQAYAQKRILLVGDSWAQQTWDNGAWPPVLSTYGLSQWSVEGATTALGGSTASVWVDPGALALIGNAIAANPTIDIIHLSIGGNDMLAGQQLGGWHTGLSPAQESALFDQMQANIGVIVDYCLSIRPDIKVGLIDYDYINLWETALAGNTAAQLMLANLGTPSPGRLNTAFTNMGLRKRAIANTRNRVLYVHNYGLQQYRHGHPGFWDDGFIYRPQFAPNTVPTPGWPPSYSPYPGGNSVYPGPRAGLADSGNDPIHLNLTGYKDICANALGQGIGGWLADLTGPTVLSIVRQTGAPNPTANQFLEFTVTFSEDVRTVAPSDFAIDASPSITGASVTNVTGSGAVRTVTVNRGSGEGQISIDFIDQDTVYDMNWRLAGNNGIPPTPGNASFYNGQAYTIDAGPPSVMVTPGITSPTFLTTAPFTAQFNESVTGFAPEDIHLSVTGPGTAQVTNFAGSGAAYTFNVSVTRSANITVEISIPAGAAFDVMSNPNTPSVPVNFVFNLPPATDGDPYLSNGALGDLILSSGNTLDIYTGAGANQPTYRINGGASINAQLIDIGAGDLVAKYNFVNVRVPAGVTVNITGDNPVAIAATQNIEWNAALNVSGVVPGRAGGGIGGAGGTGGAGGAGGAGGTTLGGGGAGVGGGQGSPNKYTTPPYSGYALGQGYPGTARTSGSNGGAGGAGGQGNDGNNGDPGTHGFRAQGTPGGGGNGGAKGMPSTVSNGGTGRVESGGNGGGGTAALATNGNPGGAGSNGNPGGAGNTGAAGGNGQAGHIGTNASFTASAGNLMLAGGPGGGGGGGGGGGAGGQGGGRGGGASSGGGGGGGGLSWCSDWPGTGCTNPDGIGGNGQNGGAGGRGGDGGAGGAAQTAGSGGAGGNGGGVVVLSARGLLNLGASLNISSSAPTTPDPERSAVGGSSGQNGLAGSGPSGGSSGGLGYIAYSAAWCIPLDQHRFYGGTGGGGGTGGQGGGGGTGGASGTSGGGGTGGLGAPGMVKLHGSVVLASGGSVICENHTGINTSDLIGRYTTISNLAAAHITSPAFSDDILTGVTTNNPVLLAPAPYNAAVDIPLIPQLQGGVATGGFCESSFWNQASVSTPGVDMLEVADLGLSTPFAGYRQIFLVNTGNGDAHDVVLRVTGAPNYVIGTVANGQIWTTCIPNGGTYTVDVGMQISVSPETVDLYAGEILTLTASVVGGSGSKTYLWLRDTQVVGVGAGNILTVDPVTVDDAGTYEVYVTDQTHSEPGDNTAVVTVDPPVSITQQPSGAVLITGDTHVLTVDADGGKGSLNFNWRKNGMSLGAPNVPFFSIGPVTGADAGIYDVVVTDSLGALPYGRETSAVAAVTVNEPLQVLGPNDAGVYDDTPSVPFTVIASGGIAPYSFTWYKDNVAVDLLDPPIAQPGAASLLLSPPLQAGYYRCVVTDSDTPSTQVDSVEGRLSVYPHLQIVAHPVDVLANPTDTVVFTAVVEGGIPPLAYTWRKDGIALPPAEQPNGPELLLASADSGNEGIYELVIADSGTDEEITTPVSLTLRNNPLFFTVHPVGAQRFTDEGPYTLSALAQGGDSGEIHYRWRFDSGTGAVTVGAGGADYEISEPAVSDSGVYWCEASEDSSFNLGVVTSNVAEVLFLERLLIVEQPIGADRYLDEDDYVLSVTAHGGTGALSYDWYFDLGTSPLPWHVGSGPIHIISSPAEADSGYYFCVVRDALDQEVTSDMAEMLFGSRMVFTKQPESGAVAPGDAWTFTVEVAGGLRALQYEWTFESAYKGKYLKALGGNSPELVLEDITEDDEGVYAVNVMDSRSIVTSEPAYLIVGTGVPAAALGGLGFASGVCALIGAHFLRRKPRKNG